MEQNNYGDNNKIEEFMADNFLNIPDQNSTQDPTKKRFSKPNFRLKFGLFKTRSTELLTTVRSPQKIVNHWEEFLKVFLSPSFEEMNQSILQFIEAIKTSKNIESDKLGIIYQEFFESCIAQMSQSSQLTKVVGDIRILTLCLERLLFHKLYDTLIFKTRDERKNLHFRLKLYQLDWVTEQHLQVPIKIMSSPANVLKFCAAQETLREISTKTCPSSKLRTLSRCCRQLFSLLNETELGRPCSADDFLPLLIYLIIKTVPQDLHSTLAFINSFGRLIYTETGEWAYYLTNVNCAVEFIDKCQSKSFTLSDDEYFSNIEKSTSKVEKMMDEIRPSLEQLKITLKTNWESYARLKNMIHTKKELKF